MDRTCSLFRLSYTTQRRNDAGNQEELCSSWLFLSHSPYPPSQGCIAFSIQQVQTGLIRDANSAARVLARRPADAPERLTAAHAPLRDVADHGKERTRQTETVCGRRTRSARTME